MAEQFGVVAGRLRRVCGEVDEASSQMAQAMSVLGAQVSGGGSRDALVGGDANSFWAQLDSVGGSVRAATSLLDDVAGLLGRAVDTFEGSDGG
jgi:hypothetical protein